MGVLDVAVSAIQRGPGDGRDVQLFLIHRLDPDPHTPVQLHIGRISWASLNWTENREREGGKSG